MHYKGNGVKKKITKISKLIRELVIVDINSDDILDRYSKIDAFSQGKLKNNLLPGNLTARNMGKNDLWIAATASVTNSTLITTDNDFSHLKYKFISLWLIDLKKK